VVAKPRKVAAVPGLPGSSQQVLTVVLVVLLVVVVGGHASVRGRQVKLILSLSFFGLVPAAAVAITVSFTLAFFGSPFFFALRVTGTELSSAQAASEVGVVGVLIAGVLVMLSRLTALQPVPLVHAVRLNVHVLLPQPSESHAGSPSVQLTLLESMPWKTT
jgi:hypothetical protein